MGVFSKLEGGLDSAFDKAAGAVFRGPIEPAQIAKRAEKQMNKEKLVGAGKQHAPTLYTVLVNKSDDNKLFAYYPTIAAEVETYLMGKGSQNHLKFDGRPLVRFIADNKLKSGKFEVIAENVAAPIIAQLRDEEAEYYGLKPKSKKPTKQAPADAGLVGLGGNDAFAPSPLDELLGEGDYSSDGYGEPNDYDALDADGGLVNFGDGGAGTRGAEIGTGLGAAGVGAGLGAAGVGAARLGVGGAEPGVGGAPLGAGLGAAALGAAAGARVGALGQNGLNAGSGSGRSVLGRARLTDMSAGRSYPLTKIIVIIGRDSSCDITLQDANISRQHAQLTQDPMGTWKMTDLHSTNGSNLNGSPATMALLCDGDELTFGVTTLVFREN